MGSNMAIFEAPSPLSRGIKILGVKTKIANDYNDHDHENRKGKNIINMFSLAK
jgi:hypothetical protein